MSGVLRVKPSIWSDRERGVRGSKREIQEVDAARVAEDAGVSLRDDIEVSFFAVGVDIAVRIHGGHVDAPLESVGVIGDAGQRAVWVAMTALRIGALEPPLHVHVGIELRYVIRAVGQ